MHINIKDNKKFHIWAFRVHFTYTFSLNGIVNHFVRHSLTGLFTSRDFPGSKGQLFLTKGTG